jgi:hypothetical protein
VEANNLAADNNITDPLGRRDLIGATISVQRGTLTTKYLGFNNLYQYFDASANSIRHATYVSFVRRTTAGLDVRANYTFGKSIDDASDASPDTRTLNTSSTQGHVTYGAPRSVDRAVSTFDIQHLFNTAAIYDLPFGKGRRFLTGSSSPVQAALGGWKISGIFRLQGGTPFLPTLVDTNRLGGNNRVVRPDLVPGVPLKNPLWTRDCPVGNLCEPYINPAAFTRPAKGSLGNAPRTIDVRGPMQHYFDTALMKDIPLGGDGKRRVQFRIDFINVFNKPSFRLNSLNFTNLPDEATLSTADYDAWAAAAAGRPLRSTPAGAALFTQIQNFVINNRQSSGALPLDFFAGVRLPQGFATTTANSLDISTLEGYKLYRIRRAYDNTFGTLRELGNPRYIQFGLKIYF